jgi:hypothetical protein
MLYNSFVLVLYNYYLFCVCIGGLQAASEGERRPSAGESEFEGGIVQPESAVEGRHDGHCDEV